MNQKWVVIFACRLIHFAGHYYMQINNDDFHNILIRLLELASSAGKLFKGSTPSDNVNNYEVQTVTNNRANLQSADHNENAQQELEAMFNFQNSQWQQQSNLNNNNGSVSRMLGVDNINQNDDNNENNEINVAGKII